MPGSGAAALAWALLALPPALSLALSLSLPLPRGDRQVKEKEALFNTTYTDWVDADLLNIYAFNHSVRRNRVSRRGGQSGRCPRPCLIPFPGSPRAGALGCVEGTVSPCSDTHPLPRGPSKVQALWTSPRQRVLLGQRLSSRCPADGGGARVRERPL